MLRIILVILLLISLAHEQNACTFVIAMHYWHQVYYGNITEWYVKCELVVLHCCLVSKLVTLTKQAAIYILADFLGVFPIERNILSTIPFVTSLLKTCMPGLTIYQVQYYSSHGTKNSFNYSELNSKIVSTRNPYPGYAQVNTVNSTLGMDQYEYSSSRNALYESVNF